MHAAHDLHDHVKSAIEERLDIGEKPDRTTETRFRRVPHERRHGADIDATREEAIGRQRELGCGLPDAAVPEKPDTDGTHRAGAGLFQVLQIDSLDDRHTSSFRAHSSLKKRAMSDAISARQTLRAERIPRAGLPP